MEVIRVGDVRGLGLGRVDSEAGHCFSVASAQIDGGLSSFEAFKFKFGL